MRYASARIAESDRNEIYRVYVAECLRASIGADLHYSDLVRGAHAEDFDAEQVVDGVISRMGLEE